MPKLKTHRGMAKRVKITANGKGKEIEGLPQPSSLFQEPEKKEKSVADRYGTSCEREKHQEVATLSIRKGSGRS